MGTKRWSQQACAEDVVEENRVERVNINGRERRQTRMVQHGQWIYLDMGLNAEWGMDGNDNDDQRKNRGKDSTVGDDNKEGKDNEEIETESKEGSDSGGVTAENVDESSDGDNGGGKKMQDVKERRSKRHNKRGSKN